MIILICTNRDSGKLVEVGLFDDMDKAHWHATKNLRAGFLYSVWTPELNGVIRAASITGLSLPPRDTAGHFKSDH